MTLVLEGVGRMRTNPVEAVLDGGARKRTSADFAYAIPARLIGTAGANSPPVEPTPRLATITPAGVSGWPRRFRVFLGNFNAALRSRVLGTKLSSPSPS